MSTNNKIITNKLTTPDWKKEYEIGIYEIDLQHQNFLRLVKKVELLSSGKLSKMDIEDILQEIIFYAQFHFRSEENLMKEFDYPDIEEHKKEHKLLSDHLLLEVSELMVHPDNYSHLHHYLIDWLLDHILEEDMKLNKHIKNIT